MKYLIIFCLFISFLTSCKKVEMPPMKPEVSYGSITFTDQEIDPSAATISTKPVTVKLNVVSVITAPFGNVMQTRIFAWNGLFGEDYRAMFFIFSGQFDDYSTAQPISVGTIYFKGANYQTGDPNSFSQYGMSKTVPAYHYLLTGANNFEYIPMQFDEIQIKTTAAQRKISCQFPEITIGGKLLSNFNMTINGFGGNLTPHNHCMTFDVNGVAAGSFDEQSFTCKNIEGYTPGIQEMKAVFTPDSRNPLQEITFDFTHHSSKLAYNGPVGKIDLLDGSGFTEIKITGVDQNGKIYREQKNKGFVVVRSEKPWYSYFNGASIVYSEGYILLEFEAELIADDGTTMTLTNGNAHYRTKA